MSTVPRHDAAADIGVLTASFVEACPHAVVVLDHAGTVVAWNRAAEGLYGRPAAEALGHPLHDLLPAGLRAAHEVLVDRVRAGDGAPLLETEHLTAGGGRLDVEVTAFPLPVPGHPAPCVALLVQDVGARRAVERELAATRRAADGQAEDLKRSNADLERFAYVASHDLSEPLRAISGLLDLLREEHGEALEEEARLYVDRSILAARRLRRLIDALLDFARLGRTPLALEQVDVQALAEDVAQDVRAANAIDGLRIEAQGLPVLRADPAQLRRVLENLIGNAVKFRAEAPPHVVIGAEDTGEAWALEVRDNGIGVPAQHAERVFEVFKRLHGRDAYDGTGIGLAVCERVVTRHGGRIEVAPADAGGSRFTFTIPHELELP